MGLHVSSIAKLGEVSTGLDDIDYFIYFLNYYQFSDDIVDAFLEELPTLEKHIDELGNTLLVTSIKNLDFFSETLSWHGICGVDPEKFGPCFLICTLPPSHFKNKIDVDKTENESEAWVLLPLNKICTTKDDLVGLLKRMLVALRDHAPLSDFEIDKIYDYENRPIITGKPKYLGIEFDLETALKKTKRNLKKISKFRDKT